MNRPTTTNGRHYRRMVGRRLIAFLTLLLLARQASAECSPAVSAAGNHPTTVSRILEAACSREDASRTLNRSVNTTTLHSTLSTTIAAGTHAGGVDAGRWSMAGALSAASVASQHEQNAEMETPVQRSLSNVHWADSRDWINNPPEWIKAARNYRRQGMPLVHLLQSQNKSSLLALGVSNRGKPGLYFTQKLPF
jgi:hypothetical protein